MTTKQTRVIPPLPKWREQLPRRDRAALRQALRDVTSGEYDDTDMEDDEAYAEAIGFDRYGKL